MLDFQKIHNSVLCINGSVSNISKWGTVLSDAFNIYSLIYKSISSVSVGKAPSLQVTAGIQQLGWGREGWATCQEDTCWRPVPQNSFLALQPQLLPCESKISAQLLAWCSSAWRLSDVHEAMKIRGILLPFASFYQVPHALLGCSV